ncbi:hypothetical protein Ae201684P_020650 [Aphanomyces euteiches]|nr:hypothetical protein Ae201684P_020650 [Aphanomyces euteiches]
MESKDVVVEHMLPLAASVKSKLLSSLDATVVQATCGVVASFARQLGAAFAPFADVLLVPLLDAACVRRKSADDDAAISMASTYCVEALAATTLLSVETLYAYFKTARATATIVPKEVEWLCFASLTRGLRMEAPSCGEATWHHCRDMHEGRVEPQYSLLKEFVREALHDNFLLVRVEARQVFSSLYDTWPERVNEFVYLPAPRIRAVLMADGYATTGIGLALQRKISIQDPAAVKRDPPKVVGPRPAVNPPNVVDFHMLLVVQLLAVLFTATVAVMAAVAQFWTTHVKGRTTHARSTSVQGEARPVLESTKHPTMQARSKEPPRSHPWTTCKW